MQLYYIIIFFILGSVFGSFLNVVGLRIPKNESIIKPSSHCVKCNKKLKWYELIPIISYLIQGGKCKNCKTHISIKYLLIEMLTGILFAISYIVFGISKDIIIPITLVCILISVIVSDIEYMIIPDQVIIIGIVLLIIENFIINNVDGLIFSITNGVLAFVLMYLIKIVGNFIFKKESLGDGDIKLMSLLGVVFSIRAIVSIIFISSFIALPYAICMMATKKESMIPYGPFISISAILLILLNLNNFSLFEFINKFIY